MKPDFKSNTEALELIGEENIFLSTSILGASLEEAWEAAEKWIAEQQVEKGEPDEH